MRVRLTFAALAWAASGAVVQANGAEPDGRALFAERCGKCHTVEKLSPELKKEPPAERAKSLEKFLTRHHAKDAAERRRLIDYLSKTVK